MVREDHRLVSKIVGYLRFGRFDIGCLAKLRLLAVRRRVWFRVLNRLERGLLDLTLKVAKRVRSRVLSNAVFSIVSKLAEALEGKVVRWMRKVGFEMAENLSRFAQDWGNVSAREWAYDLGFVRYLAVMKMNANEFNG